MTSNKLGKYFVIILMASLAFMVSCRVKSVGPWHPERTTYPRTIYKADQLDDIKARLGRFPYNELYSRVLFQADRTPAPPAEKFDPPTQFDNANIAKSAAFVFVVSGNDEYRQKAIEILKTVPQKFDTLTFELFDRDINIAEALMCYAQALDMLLGADAVNQADRNVIEDRLGNITDKFFNNWAELICGAYEFARNNHHTKMASAFGMIAIVLNNHPMAKVWIDYAMNEVETDLDSLVTADGGYAEGPNYWTYSASNVLPFAWAYHLFNNGQTETFTDRPCYLSGLGQNGKSVAVKDFFSDWKIRALSEWMIKVRQPDGFTPPVDDSNLSGYYNAIIGQVYRDGVFTWDWLTSSAYINSQSCADLSVDMICIYDDSITPGEPSWQPSMMMKEAGNAVMRSGWGADDTYVMFLAENGRARTNGYGHEHPDGLSFILYAFGKSLAIDSGYINYENHDLVRYAKNHNLILVDGKAPEPGMYTSGGVDAFFKDFMTTSFMDYCSAWTDFSGIRHSRSLLFPDKRYLVVSDDIKNNGILLHTYNWLLHGNGGGSTGGTFTSASDGGLWVNGSAALRAVVVSPEGSLNLSTYDDYHGFDWGQEKKHSVLRADIRAKNARYLAVLYPFATGTDEPEIKPLNVTDGKAITIAEPGNTTLVRIQAASKKAQSWSIDGISGKPEFPAVNSDAGLIRISAGSDGTMNGVFLEDASSLMINDTSIMSSESKIILALAFGEGIINGHVIAPSGTSINLFTGVAPLSVEGDTVSGFVSQGQGMTRISFSGQGDFTVYLSGSSILNKLMAENRVSNFL
ncbi:MAG TPA: heparinase II/III family protein [Desulfomonilia bacterium]